MLARGVRLLRLPGRRAPSCAASSSGRRPAPAPPPSSLDEALRSPAAPPAPSRTASKRRSDELRLLGKALAALPPRTLDALRLPASLRDALAERSRIEGRRAVGAGKKGRARVDALMAQLRASQTGRTRRARSALPRL